MWQETAKALILIASVALAVLRSAGAGDVVSGLSDASQAGVVGIVIGDLVLFATRAVWVPQGVFQAVLCSALASELFAAAPSYTPVCMAFVTLASLIMFQIAVSAAVGYSAVVWMRATRSRRELRMAAVAAAAVALAVFRIAKTIRLYPKDIWAGLVFVISSCFACSSMSAFVALGVASTTLTDEGPVIIMVG